MWVPQRREELLLRMLMNRTWIGPEFGPIKNLGRAHNLHATTLACFSPFFFFFFHKAPSNRSELGFLRDRERQREGEKTMALTNFILTVVGVSAAVLLLRSDVKQSAAIFRRNVRQIRQWLEEESASAAK